MADVKLDKSVFAVEVPNHELLKLAYEAHLAANRQVGAKTLRRGEVSGGGKKPWRQKGTGRARFGSSRNPIWRGGGVAFGPLGIENYNKTIAKSAKRVALRQALTLANQDKKIVIIDTFACPNGKTKETVALLNKYKVSDQENVLLVVSVKDDLVIRATSNLQNVKVVNPTYLSVFDILNADKILISEKALPMIVEWLKGDK
ncbi:50S ribosomal protein L4 [Candidatus Saccharibacteria bacterium]|nr:50S ribosomal protein L4 [Candidatus Saccharibacteria bacterium]MCL1962687.1 50S ribosomal protein L4 [Candidatus Saccharibacteria bacterium]